MNRRTFLGALLAMLPVAGLARSLPKETPALAEGEQFDLDILKALRSLPGGMGPNRITGITAPDGLRHHACRSDHWIAGEPSTNPVPCQKCSDMATFRFRIFDGEMMA